MADFAVFSDIHGNHSAFQAAIDYACGRGKHCKIGHIKAPYYDLTTSLIDSASPAIP